MFEHKDEEEITKSKKSITKKKWKWLLKIKKVEESKEQVWKIIKSNLKKISKEKKDKIIQEVKKQHEN